MKRLLTWITLGVLLGFGTLFFFPPESTLAKKDEIKVCHSGNGTNFSEVKVDKDAWDEHTSGHSDHEYDFKVDREHPCPPVDVCSNIDLVQATVPEGYYEQEGECFYDSTHRWCKLICNDERTFKPKECENPSYEAIAVKDRDENPEGKPWETGMDKYCKFPEPTPTPTPTPTPIPTPVYSGVSDGKAPAPTAPVCSDGTTIKLVANFHIIRTLERAELKWVPTEGSQVNIYYKRVEQSNWEHAVGDVPNNGSFTINKLNPNLGYTFGIQQKNGCGGGQIATAVVEDPPAKGVMFRFSYWQWE